mgnify:FL=1
MSTYFRPTEPISLNKIKKLKDIKVIFNKEQDTEILFDGTNYVHFDCDKNKNVIDFFRYGRNDETYILETLEKNFDVSMIDEHDEDYQDLQSDDTNVITIKLEEN